MPVSLSQTFNVNSSLLTLEENRAFCLKRDWPKEALNSEISGTTKEMWSLLSLWQG